MNYRARELATIAAVLGNLRRQQFLVDSPKEQLVIEALRRSNNNLENASLVDLGNYVCTLNDVQLKGLANNIKGIYHELLFIKEFNQSHANEQAELFSSTTNPGADVIIRDVASGEVIQELQLKASDNPHYVVDHLVRFPDIELRATTEVAETCSKFASSGISNNELEGSVNHQLEQLHDVSGVGQAITAASTSTLVAGGLRALECLNGRTSPAEAIGKTAADVALATGTSAFVAFLFS